MSCRPRSAKQRAIAGAGAATLAAVAGELAVGRMLRRGQEYRLLSAFPEGRATTVISADGTRIHAETFGPEETDAPTFVLAPGWTEELQIFGRVIQQLVYRGYRAVAYDLRGQGASGLPAGGQEIHRYGEDIEAVLEATCAGRDDVILAGHSLGGMSIAAWAAAHDVGARIAAAALLSTGFADLVAGSRLFPRQIPAPVRHHLGERYVLRGTTKPLPVTTTVSRRVLRRTAFAPDASEASIVFYEQMLRRCPVPARVAAGRAVSRLDLLHAVPRITVPTVVLVGTHDRLTPPSHSERIAASLPKLTKLIVLDDIGHMSPLECPGRVVAELAGLADHARPRALVSGA